MALLIVALIILVAIVGFWDAIGAILGGIALLIVLVLLAGGFAIWAGYRAFKKPRGPRH